MSNQISSFIIDLSYRRDYSDVCAASDVAVFTADSEEIANSSAIYATTKFTVAEISKRRQTIKKTHQKHSTANECFRT